MSREEHLQKMIANLTRRLQIRDEQRALEGPDTPPKVLIEIEDSEKEISNLQAELNELVRQDRDDVPTTVDKALELYTEEIGKSRASGTLSTYHYTIQRFKRTLIGHDIKPEKTSLSEMSNDWIHWFLDDLRVLEPTTERGYLAPIIGFYEFVVAKNWRDLNLTEMRFFIKRRQRKLPQKAQRFPKQKIETLLTSMDDFANNPFKDDREQLMVLRDCALLFTLADTGLRVSEACSLKRGQIDFLEAELYVTGKGNKEARIRISERTLSRLKRYLEKRKELDAAQPLSPAELALFARHDKRVGEKIQSMSSRSVQQLIDRYVSRFLGNEYLREITPHTFRHYFVTKVLRSTGGDVEVAKKLARHADISTTMRYAHLSEEELDRVYYDIFDDV